MSPFVNKGRVHNQSSVPIRFFFVWDDTSIWYLGQVVALVVCVFVVATNLTTNFPKYTLTDATYLNTNTEKKI